MGTKGQSRQKPIPAPAAAPGALPGVVIGLIVELRAPATPVVVFPGNPQEAGVPARTTGVLSQDDVGQQVALLFENGDPARPLIIGRIQAPLGAPDTWTVEVDQKRMTITAQDEIVLRCGKASITLTRAGKILMRGKYLSSRSSGVNRIKGGSVQIN